MATKTYAEKLKDPRWQKKRLAILDRDKFSCRICGGKDSTLHVHHHYYEKNKEPWEYDDECLITLCESCHDMEEERKAAYKNNLNIMLERGVTYRELVEGLKITWVKYLLDHGLLETQQ